MENSSNTIASSIQTHGKTSYYHSDKRVSEKDKEILKSNEVIGDGSIPKFLATTEIEKKGKTIEIKKYTFMNDGIWIKVIIEIGEFKEWINLTEKEIFCDFGEKNFKLTVKPENSFDQFVLNMKETREKIIPEKCKFYIRKNKIYIALYKIKEEEWWTLKGV